MSDQPLVENTWGGIGDDVHFHSDGEIGWALHSMGADQHMDVDGQPLGNVLGRIATDAVKGRTTTEQAVARLAELRDRLPEGTAARSSVSQAVDALSAPPEPVPSVPASAPEPLRQLMSDLNAVPLVRQDPSKERDALAGLLADFDAGKTGGTRFISAIEQLRNRRHESKEGKFEIDRAIGKASAALNAMFKADRQSLYPPKPQ